MDQLRACVRAAAERAGLPREHLHALRLFAESATESTGPLVETPEEIGYLYESLLSRAPRKKSGSFYTPTRLVEGVVNAAFTEDAAERELRICDPAMGAGAFLI